MHQAVPSSAALETRSRLSGRLSGEDRRRQLLDCAIELFAKHGFNGTRTKDIAAAAGVSESILFRHFATKEDLYHAILETQESYDWLGELKRHGARHDDRALLHCLVRQIVDSFRQNPAFHRLMLYARLEGHMLAGLFHERMGAPAHEFLRGYVAQRQRDGVFRDGDPAVLVLQAVAPVLHYSMCKHVFGIDVLRLSDEEMIEELSNLAVAGLRAPRKRNKTASGRA